MGTAPSVGLVVLIKAVMIVRRRSSIRSPSSRIRSLLLFTVLASAPMATMAKGEGSSVEEGGEMRVETLSKVVSNATRQLDEIHVGQVCESGADLICIPLCCPPMSRVSRGKCFETNLTVRHFPTIHDPATFLPSERQLDDRKYRFFVRKDLCQDGMYSLEPEADETDAFLMLTNGTVHRYEFDSPKDTGEYCLGLVEGRAKYDILLCFDAEPTLEGEEGPDEISIATPIGLIISTPFLFLTLLVYTIVPELRTMHGRTLRGYVGCLLVAYIVIAYLQLDSKVPNAACITMAFIIHFSFLASFFWLNVMCFDIWWTFGGFRSLQGSAKQRERKKFIMYSIYAWGGATILTGICVIMDYVPSVPKSFIRPQFGSSKCWFTTENAKAIYFYGPVGITVLCNICLFISTALKIIHHKKDTAHHLKGSESRRHDDNKQWFNLYLKLFIVMGINWSMEIVSWACKGCPAYLWYITDLANTLQGIIIFIIFVWKNKIKRLLLKRFGCHRQSILSRNSTRSAYHSSTSRTCTTAAPLQDKVSPYVHESYRARNAVTDDSDCA